MIEHRKPITIGIVGDSAAGKTTFAAGVAAILGPERTLTICVDDYHRYSRAERKRRGITPQDPDCNYLDILEQHIALLRQGAAVLKPVYNHQGGTLEPPEYVTPKPFIILEGLLGYATPKLRDAYDVKFYLEPQEDLRLRWKFQRDVGTGGYSVEELMQQQESLQRDSRRFVRPQREYADMVVSFFPPDHRPDESGAGLNVRHLLRPTLPYFDLAPLLEGSPRTALDLELARDMDGRPVDVLTVTPSDIPGRLGETVAYLRTQLPRQPTGGDGIGLYSDHDGKPQYSPVLAVSQLLVTHYLLTAAAGEHALRGE